MTLFVEKAGRGWDSTIEAEYGLEFKDSYHFENMLAFPIILSSFKEEITIEKTSKLDEKIEKALPYLERHKYLVNDYFVYYLSTVSKTCTRFGRTLKIKNSGLLRLLGYLPPTNLYKPVSRGKF
ncbi:MAG: hypothetical protein IPL49_22095 [Saprospirales bacterium]|nr:hypothetical protein [Saprospirales bacterium]